jgi:hypothetical protein
LSAAHTPHATKRLCAAASEHLSEHVVHSSTTAWTSSTSEHARHSLLLFVLIAFFGCANGVVGFLNFLEFGFCSRIIRVSIRMVLSSLFAESTLDFSVASIPAHA